jgi:manganese/zinc/iron transport system permease protein
MPTGPVIVLCGAAIFLFSVLFAPRRGVISRVVSEVNLRRKTARENLLRTLYELSEYHLDERPPIALEAIRARRAWTLWAARWLLAAASRRGDVEWQQNQVRLTPKGLRRAADVTRAHRLWEIFLIEGANIASDHVDRDADSIEHVLTPDTLDALEKRLADSGALPEEDRQVPVSPHALDESAAAPNRNS